MFNFLFNFFKTNKLYVKNRLFKWLKDHSASIKVSSRSIYFNIDGIEVRYSDHFSKSSSGELSIIDLSDCYIVIIAEYKVPKIFKKSSEITSIITFIENFIFFYKCYHRELIQPLQDIIEAKKSKLIHTNIETNKEASKLKELILEDSKSINNITTLKAFQHFSKNFQEIIIIYLKSNPDKYDKVLEYVKTFAVSSKIVKRRHWKKLIANK